MNYSVNILYKSEVSDNVDPLWEESIILITAIDEKEAILKAEKYAKKNEVEYESCSLDNVKWRYYKIERIYLIEDNLVDGVELFSRFLRNSEVESILSTFD